MNEAKSLPMDWGQDTELRNTVPTPAESTSCGMEQNQMTAKENSGSQGAVENSGL